MADTGGGEERRAALAVRLDSVAIRLLRRVRAEAALSGLSPARLSALSVLVYGGARTIGELAAAEQVAAPTMTRLVSALERDGLVRREADRRDGRLVRVEPSARARELLEAARQRRLRLLADRLGGFDEVEWTALKHTVAALERVIET
jgi:DNA-binding MarR family transcriptional regulator